MAVLLVLDTLELGGKSVNKITHEQRRKSNNIHIMLTALITSIRYSITSHSFRTTANSPETNAQFPLHWPRIDT